jgi:hypothetical protein
MLATAAAVAMTACGGSAFVAGDADGDVDASSAPDAQATDGGAPPEASIDAPPPATAIACVPDGGTCARTCCVSRSTGAGTGYDFRCEDGVACGAAGDTGLHCNDSLDCRTDQVCCIAKVGSAFASFCAASCTTGEAQLCTLPADARCPVGGACVTTNISTWGLPSTFGTCDGVSAP